MSILLLIRSADDVRSAVEQASQFLVYRRRHFAEPREADEVLGIWLRRELDADLPAWLWFDRARGVDVRMDGRDAQEAAGHCPEEAAVGVRESFSLSGLWAICWIDGSLLLEGRDPRERRRRILDAFVKDVRSEGIMQPGTFFPVFEATEPSDSIDATLRELRARYPHFISGAWFVNDREGGILGPRGRQ